MADFWDDVETAAEGLPVGTYETVIVEACYAEGETGTGKKYTRFEVQWQIKDGSRFDGWNIWDNFWRTLENSPGAERVGRGQFKKMCQALNVAPSTVDPAVGGDVSSLLGKRVKVRTKSEEYNGKVRAKAAGFYPSEKTVAAVVDTPPVSAETTGSTKSPWA